MLVGAACVVSSGLAGKFGLASSAWLATRMLRDGCPLAPSELFTLARSGCPWAVEALAVPLRWVLGFFAVALLRGCTKPPALVL